MPESMGPTYIIIGAIALVIVFIIAFVLGMLYRKKVSEREIFSAEEEAKRIINESIKSAENKNAKHF
jgi:ribonuclease Y